jgi:hypothetical protein
LKTLCHIFYATLGLRRDRRYFANSYEKAAKEFGCDRDGSDRQWPLRG